MEKVDELVICKSCKAPADAGKYCSVCGQALAVKRISVGSIAHEVFHFFTHLDKGFPYTLKQLLSRPGHMQHEYLEGHRVRHQKPFSMFLISATVLALALYWINILLSKYFEAGDLREAAFFDKYMVLLLLFMAPLFAFITWIAFYRAGYNYAEILVLSLYTISVFFLFVMGTNFLKLIWPTMQTRIVEIPLVIIYNAITFNNFFKTQRRWIVIAKSVVCSFLSFSIIAMTQDWLIERVT